MIIAALILLLCIALGACVYIFAIGYGIFFGAPYVGTNKAIARSMLHMAKANSEDIVLDLGCGAGNILIIAAKEFHVKKVIGYDVNALLILIARFRFFLLKKQGFQGEAEFYIRPLAKVNQHADITLITVYVLPSLMHQIQKLAMHFPPHAKIISHGFAFSKGKPEEERRIHNTVLRLYTRNGVMPHDYERGNRT